MDILTYRSQSAFTHFESSMAILLFLFTVHIDKCPLPFDNMQGFILLSTLFKGTLAVNHVIAINIRGDTYKIFSRAAMLGLGKMSYRVRHGGLFHSVFYVVKKITNISRLRGHTLSMTAFLGLF